MIRIIITFGFFPNEKYSTTDMLLGFSSLSQILANARIPFALGRMVVEREKDSTFQITRIVCSSTNESYAKSMTVNRGIGVLGLSFLTYSTARH